MADARCEEQSEKSKEFRVCMDLRKHFKICLVYAGITVILFVLILGRLNLISSPLYEVKHFIRGAYSNLTLTDAKRIYYKTVPLKNGVTADRISNETHKYETATIIQRSSNSSTNEDPSLKSSTGHNTSLELLITTVSLKSATKLQTSLEQLKLSAVNVSSKSSPTVHSEAKSSPTINVSSKSSPTVHSEAELSPTEHSEAKSSPTVHSKDESSTTVNVSSKSSPTIQSEAKSSPIVNVSPKLSPTVHSEAKSSPTVNASSTTVHSVAKLSTTKQSVSKSVTINVSAPISSPTKQSLAQPTIVTSTMELSKQRRDLMPSTTSKFKICTSNTGRLGNQLFEFASGFGVAAKKGMGYTVNRLWVVPSMFEISEQFLIDSNECGSYKGIGENNACAFDPKLFNIKNDSNIRLGLYLQSWKYFIDSADSLRKQLVFKKWIREKSKSAIETIMSKHKIRSRANVVLVGVHIRRGDMVNNGHGYNVATKEYLWRAVNHFTSKKLTNLIFVVCSDDMKWSKTNMPNSSIISEYMTSNEPVVDMSILASCNHTITTVGSFGWWAAWLANGEVIYFKWPAKENTSLRRVFSKTYLDYFYPGWIGL